MKVESLRKEFVEIQAEIAAAPFVPEVTASEIRAHLGSRYDFERPQNLEDIVRDVEEMLRRWQVQVTHPRYLGLFNPSVTLASVVADTMVAIYNPQLANWRTSPAANEIERHTLGWLRERFGLPSDSVASFTSGGMEANLSATVVALTRAFPGYGEHGLRHLPAQPAIYLTAESHHGFHKIAHMVGLGRQALRIIPTDSRLRMDVSELKRCVEADRQEGWLPFLVVATAGTTAAGVIDPLPQIGQFCQQQDLWYHVDAAWGGAAILSATLKRHLDGIEMADSITCDAHKWFSVSMGAGMFFCRHRESVAEAFHAGVSYMPGQTGEMRDEDIWNPLSTTAQWSRRFIGLKLFLTLAERGEHGIATMIDHQARMGDLLRILLLETGWRVINVTALPLVCFTREGLDPASLLATLRKHQIAWMSEATISGVPAVRACITSFRTTEADVRWIVGEINRLMPAGTSSSETESDILPERNQPVAESSVSL